MTNTDVTTARDSLIEFTVPGEPVAKGRHRTFMHQGVIKSKTPVKTVNYETLIAEMFFINYPRFVPLDGPLAIGLKMFMKVPPSDSKKKQAAKLAGEIRPTKKPDFSNVLKVAEDALNNRAFIDDKQIVDILPGCGKWYSDRPRIEITIQRVEAPKQGDQE